VTRALVDPAGGVAVVSDTITFTIRITNTGRTVINSLVVTDTYDAACMSLTSTDPVTSTQDTGQATWNLAGLSLGLDASKVISVEFHAGAPSPACTNTVTVTGVDEFSQTVGPEQSSDDVQTTAPNLSISKVASPATDVTYHSEVTYTIVLSNNGTADAAGVRLANTLPVQVDFQRWVRQPAGANVDVTDVLTWNGAVTMGEAITFTLVVTHTGDYAETVVNTALYSHTSGSGSAQATFTVQSSSGMLIRPGGAWELAGPLLPLVWKET
jgi:uncharacterized repeat protein (TIGR01451 family)